MKTIIKININFNPQLESYLLLSTILREEEMNWLSSVINKLRGKDTAKNVILFVDLENLANFLWKTSPFKIQSFEELQKRCRNMDIKSIGGVANILANAILHSARVLKEREKVKWIDWIVLIAKSNGHKCLLNPVKSALEDLIRKNNWKTIVSYQIIEGKKDNDDQFITTLSLRILRGQSENLNKYDFIKGVPKPLYKLLEEVKERIKNKKEGIAILSNDRDFEILKTEKYIYLLKNFTFIKDTNGKIQFTLKS